MRSRHPGVLSIKVTPLGEVRGAEGSGTFPQALPLHVWQASGGRLGLRSGA